MMILAAIGYTGISVLVYFLSMNFVIWGASKAFWIFLGVGPIYLIANYLTTAADQNINYKKSWTLTLGYVLSIVGITVFSIRAIAPFFSTWRAVSGFWPHTLLFFIGSWIVYLLMYAIIFLFKMFS